jgi:hypothetical protein
MSVLSSHAWQPVVPTIQPINQVLLKPGSWSWCEFSIHITWPSTSLLSSCAFSLHITRRRSKLLTCFIEFKRHHPAYLQHHTFLISSSSPSAFCIPVACLFVCLFAFFGVSFVCLFALASRLSIEVCYLEYLPASCLYRSSQSYLIRISPTRR